MKKRISLILAMLMAVSALAACGGGAPAATTAATTTAAATTAAPTTAASAEPETTAAAEAATEAATTAKATEAETTTAAPTTVAETTTEAPAPAEDVTLRFIHIWPEHHGVMVDSVNWIQDRFGFKINLSEVPWNEITSTIQTSLAANDMYDVFFAWGGQIPGYHNTLDCVLDIQPYMDADPSWMDLYMNTKMFHDFGYDAGVEGGDIYGIPFRGTGEFLIVNKSMFAENGWSVPVTREDLVALADEMISKDIIPISAFGTPNAGRLWDAKNYITDYLYLASGDLLTPEYAVNRLAQRDGGYRGQMAEGAEITRGWFKLGYFGPSPFGLEREEAQNVFFSGRAGMMFCNNNELMDLRSLAADSGIEIGAMAWPGPADASTEIAWGGFNDGFAAWKETKYPEQAAMLLKGLSQPEVMTQWGDKGYSIMPIKGLHYEDELLQYWADYFANSKVYPVNSDYNGGSMDENSEALFTDFCLSDMAPQDYEDQVTAIQINQIADSDEQAAGN